MRQTYLHSDWVFKNASPLPPYLRDNVQYQPWTPATVPGHVHLDLVDAGVIQDPFRSMAELGSRWVDETEWTYRTVFNWTSDPELPRRVLLFEGLDTVCRVLLNGALLGEFDNMFVPVELDVTDKLIEGDNELEVQFESAVKVGDIRRKAYFEAEGLATECKRFDERAFVRKAQYMSAWDWGPRLVSCGIWQPVSLLEFAARVKSFTVLQTPEGDGVRVRTVTEVEGDADLTLRFGDLVVETHSSSIQEIDALIEDPIWWWPNGMGEQFLYEASAEIEGDAIVKRVGLRTIVFERKPDEIGESFTFFVNGQRLWARGANWIPNDSFPSRVSGQDYLDQILTCKALGMNMLRIWGGGLYELEGFYDACDEAGILVWQDFAYACSYYPDGEAACAIAANEAEVQVRRLRDRTSLALWCGNNENLTMWQGKWGGADSPPRYYGENIYNGAIPEVLQRLDPTRGYIPSSPIGQKDDSGNSNDGRFGDSHYWDVWHGRGDWIHYRDSDTRFSSEFGFASSCSLSQWEETLEPTEWEYDSLAVRWHDKTGKAWETFWGYVVAHYPDPTDLESWTYYSQLNQRDALRYGIEHWRRSTFCQGTLIWQFNDCWPVQSWAVQDYLRLLKPAGYELSRLYHDQLISLVRKESEVEIFLVNDGFDEWDADLALRVFSLQDGALIHETLMNARLDPGARAQLESFDFRRFGQALIRVSSADGIQAECLTGEPKELEFGAPEFEVEHTDDELTILVKGIAVDLVIVDPDSPANLLPSGCEVQGAKAQTLANEATSFTFSTRPNSLYATWLHGSLVMDLEEI